MTGTELVPFVHTKDITTTMDKSATEDGKTPNLSNTANAHVGVIRDGSVYIQPQSTNHANQKNGNRGFSEPKQHIFEKPLAKGNSTQENGDVGKTTKETSDGTTKEVSFIDDYTLKDTALSIN